MKQAIFLDSSGFYALLHSREPAHSKAVQISKELAQASIEIITTDYILSETYTLLRARGLDHKTPAFNHLIESSTQMKIIWITPDLFGETERFFLKHADKGYSFTDCLSFIVMKKLKLTEAMTTDQHFAQAGFKALLT